MAVHIQDYRLNSEHWVNVTHITDPHNFYVQPCHYKYYQEAMELKNSNLNVNFADLKIGDIVVFKSNNKKNFLRGNIIFINDTTKVCDIFAIDYGSLANSVSPDCIFHLTEIGKILDVPPLAINCQLADCVPIDGKTWKAEAIEAMKYYLGKKKTKMIIKGNLYGKYLVELQGPSTENIATLMVLTGYSCLPCSTNSVSRISVPKTEKHYYTYRERNPGDILHVRALTGNSMDKFFVAEINDYQDYLDERDTFTQFYKTFPAMLVDELKVDRAIGVFTSQFKAERGFIKKVLKDQKAEVDLVDIGGSEVINLDSMKKMSKSFFERTPAALYCRLEDTQLQDYRYHKYLLPGYEFLITILEVGSKFDNPNIVCVSNLPAV